MYKLKPFQTLWVIGLFAGIVLWLILPPTLAQPLSAMVALGLLISLLYISRHVTSTELEGRQHLYHALFEQNNDAIYWVDFNGTIIRVNQQACDLLGYTSDEFPSLTMADIIVDAEVSHAQNSLERLIQGERVPIYERTMRRKDGELRYVEINIQVVYDSQDTPICIQSVMRDISDRKRSQQALSDSEKRLRTLISALPDNTFIIDVDGRYQTVLKSDYETSSPLYNNKPRQGQFLHEIFPQDHADFCLEKIRETIELDTPQIIEYTSPFRGEPFRLETRIIPYHDPRLGQQLVFWVTREITERVMGEQHRLDLTLEKEKLKILREFVDGIVHDLKTPLTVITTSLHLMRHYDDPLKREEKMQVMKRQTDLVTQMLDDMLALVQLDTIPQVQFEQVDLGSLMQEIIDDLNYKAEEKQIKLDFHKLDMPMVVEGSRNQLRRALSNLVDNAIKYTLQAGDVNVKMYYDETYFRLDVRDTGIGIGGDDMAQIFDRFVRGNNAYSVASGTGLGLAITKRIIDMHGGLVTVESELNQGSTFYVKLPQIIQSH